ncbi:MAG: HD domain-containing protein [Nitrospirae bacterium]|nr:HD domain-containing protein [Nitrospirota bacterium]
MKTDGIRISFFDLVSALSTSMDLVSPAIVNHQMRVAYIAFCIGKELGLSQDQQGELLIAGALHDSGAFSLKERLDILNFEFQDPHKHAELGYLLLKNFKPFADVSGIVRFHHVLWNDGIGTEFNAMAVPIGSHILHLSDRASVLINEEQEIIGQSKMISGFLKKGAGKLFVPEIVDAFRRASDRESFWFDVMSPHINIIVRRLGGINNAAINDEILLDLADLFRRLIDFRSRFTATHSSGVVASAESLARLAGFSSEECLYMRVAGSFHDLGKLAVPAEILEKPGKLTEDEFAVVKRHAYHSYTIMDHIKGLETINKWASFHHERLDGSGYPFRVRGEELSVGSQIMAVADVFTAITENRPYRKGMGSEDAKSILNRMAQNSALNPDIVALLTDNFDEVNSLRMAAQEISIKEYGEFINPQNPMLFDI